MVARSVPDWPARCHFSRAPMSLGFVSGRALATTLPGAASGPLSRFQISACSRSSAAIALTSGAVWAL